MWGNMPIINYKPKLNKIDNVVPKFLSIEKNEVSEVAGFKTYDQAGMIYDQPDFTYDGITGWSGNPPKL